MSDLRVYVPGVDEFDSDGYPLAWQTIKHDVREAAGHRCVRCGHPYRKGQHGSGGWSPCDVGCAHLGPIRWREQEDGEWLHIIEPEAEIGRMLHAGHVGEYQAHWRILTVHHLTGEKADCRWWNLASLCQRCHLEIQGRVVMDRVWPHEHSFWFRPYAAGYYAWRYLGEDIDRDVAIARVDELLALEVRQLTFTAAREDSPT